MGLFDISKIAKLDKLKAGLIGSAGLGAFSKITNNVNLNNISLDNLKSLTNSRFTQGVDWKNLNLPKMDSDLMNKIAPGSLGISSLKKKLSNSSLLKGRTTEVVDTQSGMMANTSEIRINGDVEDVVSAKAVSQGTNMQMANRARQINAESSSLKSIQSNFVGRNTVT